MTAEPAPTITPGEPADNADVEARLLQVALPLFAREGFGGVSVRQIAQAAGVTTPSLYHYFGSKRGLYLRLVHELIERRSTAMRAALGSRGNAITRLRRALEAYASLGEPGTFPREAHLLLQRESFGFGGNLFPDVINESDASNRRVIQRIVQDGIDEGLFRPVRVEHTAIAIIGVLVTFVRRGARSPKIGPEDGIAQVLDVMLDGLRPRSEADAPAKPQPTRSLKASTGRNGQVSPPARSV
jgi:AcrR family transcriptional regulator